VENNNEQQSQKHVHTYIFGNQRGKTPKWGNPPREIYYSASTSTITTTIIHMATRETQVNSLANTHKQSPISALKTVPQDRTTCTAQLRNNTSKNVPTFCCMVKYVRLIYNNKNLKTTSKIVPQGA
jgi:hypothetical protein